MNAIANVSDRRFSVVLPCYNEAENIVQLVEEIVAAMTGDSSEVQLFEVIIVDDCSDDGTSEAVRQHFPIADAPVRVVRHAANYGQSAAICSGVAAATFPWIITLDGDGQNDPADIPKLIARLASAPSDAGSPMICGQRVNRRDDWLRKFSSKVANAVRAKLLGDATPDTGCGLKLFATDAFQYFPQFDHMHRFLPALAKREGGYVESVAVNHRPRIHGVSKYGLNNRLWVGLVDLCGVMWLQRRKFRGRDSQQS